MKIESYTLNESKTVRCHSDTVIIQARTILFPQAVLLSLKINAPIIE